MSKKEEMINEIIEEMNEDQMYECKKSVETLIKNILNKKALIRRTELKIKQLKIQLEAAELPEEIKF